MRGADIEKLRDLSSDFQKKATELHHLISHLNNKSNGSDSYWKGPKADKFRDEWRQVKPTLDQFVKTLDDARDATKKSADNIERAT